MEENKTVFDDMTPQDKMPASAKADVMNRIATAKLALSFWDLFAQKRMEVSLNTFNQSQTKSIEKK